MIHFFYRHSFYVEYYKNISRLIGTKSQCWVIVTAWVHRKNKFQNKTNSRWVLMESSVFSYLWRMNISQIQSPLNIQMKIWIIPSPWIKQYNQSIRNKNFQHRTRPHDSNEKKSKRNRNTHSPKGKRERE